MLTPCLFQPCQNSANMFGLTVNFPCSVSFIFCGQCLTMLNSVVHLGNYLLMNLANDLDNQMKSMDFLNRHICCTFEVQFRR